MSKDSKQEENGLFSKISNLFKPKKEVKISEKVDITKAEPIDQLKYFNQKMERAFAAAKEIMTTPLHQEIEGKPEFLRKDHKAFIEEIKESYEEKKKVFILDLQNRESPKDISNEVIYNGLEKVYNKEMAKISKKMEKPLEQFHDLFTKQLEEFKKIPKEMKKN